MEEAAGAELGPGSVLGGKYRLTRFLGDGAMGVVFAGVHERLGRDVAVKVLRSELGSHRDAVARFQREAELVARIGHPSIVAVYDYGRADNGSVYYVMEFITGRPLRARLNQGPLTDDEIVAVFGPLLAAVESAHAVGAVHRDLKPENVMLVPRPDGKPGRPEVKLLDFGVAKLHAETISAQPIRAFSDSLRTSAGAMMGTPAYMAPEQIRSASTVDQRADIYAIGVILFEALTGERPFQAGSIADLMASHLFTQPERPSVVSTRKKLPARRVNWRVLDQVVARMLAKRPPDPQRPRRKLA